MTYINSDKSQIQRRAYVAEMQPGLRVTGHRVNNIGSGRVNRKKFRPGSTLLRMHNVTLWSQEKILNQIYLHNIYIYIYIYIAKFGDLLQSFKWPWIWIRKRICRQSAHLWSGVRWSGVESAAAPSSTRRDDTRKSWAKPSITWRHDPHAARMRCFNLPDNVTSVVRQHDLQMTSTVTSVVLHSHCQPVVQGHGLSRPRLTFILALWIIKSLVDMMVRRSVSEELKLSFSLPTTINLLCLEQSNSNPEVRFSGAV